MYLEGEVKRIARTYHVAITSVGQCVVIIALLVSHLKTMYTFSIKEVLEFSKSYIHAPCIAPDCEQYALQRA